jgi:tRNA(fMet)-specific endonuclease VapC
MTDSLLLDTSVVISHLRRSALVTEKLKAADFLYLPIIALGELFHGACVLPFPERQREKINRFLGAVTILGLTHTTAENFGQISAELRAVGKPIPTNDIWIAALAREHRLPLAAHDEHFDRVSNITVLQW